MFPNPSSSGVFQIKSQTPVNWEVYNIDGSKIISGKGNKVDLSAYSRGIYILRMGKGYVKIVY